MTRARRLLVSLFALLGLTIAISACGDDDGEDTAGSTTTEADIEATTTTAPEGDEGDEGGPPEVNPCAEGESGTLGPPGDAPPAEASAVSVTGKEYEFEGLEALSATGTYAVTFDNGGQELHELVIQKIDDDETRSLEELLTVEDPSEFVEDVAFTFACPGATAEPVTVELATPGRYVAMCFIPTGTTPETPPSDFETLGPPHAMQGMIQEITVS